MNPRRRRQEGVDDRDRSHRAQTAPFIGDRGVDGQQSISENQIELWTLENVTATPTSARR